MPRYRLDIEYDGSPMPAGSGRPASIRCRRRSSRRSWASAARRVLAARRRPHRRRRACDRPGGACRPDAGTGRHDTVRDAVNAHLQLAGETRRPCSPPARWPTTSTPASPRPAGTISTASSTGARRRPWSGKRAWWVPKPLDADAMHEAAQASARQARLHHLPLDPLPGEEPACRTLDRLDVTRPRRR